MFECFVRSHVCLSVSPSTHRKQLDCVDAAFYFKLGFGWDIVWGWGWGCFYFEFLVDYFFLREFF